MTKKKLKWQKSDSGFFLEFNKKFDLKVTRVKFKSRKFRWSITNSVNAKYKDSSIIIEGLSKDAAAAKKAAQSKLKLALSMSALLNKSDLFMQFQSGWS